ncbi:Pyruvate oxidase [Parasponia andersonii]|uniref:acetolactate synthase n=1 Tax=Parasponia andersonii TaxID=3476 RepID=A0A2P5DVK3_PARAD|nr:Pyruvate oxidase [Parasponia andersonii]
MAASTNTLFISSPKPILRFSLPFSSSPPNLSSLLHVCSLPRRTPPSPAITTIAPDSETFNFVSRYGPYEPGKGADVLVEAFERQGVTDVFAYPGGATLEIHQALTRSNIIRNILPLHEQSGIFAAEGYARSSSSGLPGMCIATSGPGATNLISGLADALFDSMYNLVLDVEDIPRVVNEAYFLATAGRPGPVLIDIPKDIQQELVVPDWDQPIKLHGYLARLPKLPNQAHLEQIVRLISKSKKPVLYVGGGCLDSSKELRRCVELTKIPVASTLMGLGAYTLSNDLSLQMLGMHGSVYANNAVDKCDLLLAFGVRFDDRIVHIDIDSAEIGKKKQPHISICGDVKPALEGMTQMLEKKASKLKLDFTAWRQELDEQKEKYRLGFKTFGEAIAPQNAIQVLNELTSHVNGLHQEDLELWAFGLPAAMGAAVANPDSIIVDIDGDGSFMINVQELATIRVENLPVKILLLNNQHLGMAVQWEDPSYKANRAHSYLGDPLRESKIFPNMLKFADACGIPAARVKKKEEVRGAIQKMLDTPGPYLLDVIIPRQEHVLPMFLLVGLSKM